MNQDIIKSKIKLLVENLIKLETNLPKNFEDFQKNDIIVSAEDILKYIPLFKEYLKIISGKLLVY
jgi:hypothetical protein